MPLYNQTYLWNLVEHLTDDAPIYQETMSEDENSRPQTYVVLQNQTFDETFKKGDGKILYRENTFTIRINAPSIEKINELLPKYRKALEEKDIDYSQYSPIQDPTTGRISVQITGSYLYG